MTQADREKKLQQAEEELIRAKNKLARVKKETKEALRKEQNHHKYMMGGAVAKYFPKCFEFNEAEMNRIIAYAFKNADLRNLILLIEQDRVNAINVDQKENIKEYGEEEKR